METLVSGRIVAEVYDPSGNKVPGGSRGFSFNAKSTKGNFKIIVINKTNNRQNVEVTLNQSDS